MLMHPFFSSFFMYLSPMIHAFAEHLVVSSVLLNFKTTTTTTVFSVMSETSRSISSCIRVEMQVSCLVVTLNWDFPSYTEVNWTLQITFSQTMQNHLNVLHMETDILYVIMDMTFKVGTAHYYTCSFIITSY